MRQRRGCALRLDGIAKKHNIPHTSVVQEDQMNPVTFTHKNYKATVRRNPQNNTFVVFLYRDGELVEREVFDSYDVAHDYASRVVIIEDLCDELGLR